MSPAQTRNTELRPGTLSRRLVLSRGDIGKQLLEMRDLLLGDVTGGEQVVQQTRVAE